jgi:hypothetical protein
MPPTYRLTYFNVKGLGEMSRLLLAIGGATWEDDRIDFSVEPGPKVRGSPLSRCVWVVNCSLRMAP